MKFSGTWTAGLSEEEAKALEHELKNSRKLLKRLNYIFDQKMKGAQQKMISEKAYDKPCWSEYQADQIGYLRALNEINQLFNERD